MTYINKVVQFHTLHIQVESDFGFNKLNIKFYLDNLKVKGESKNTNC